MKSIKRVFAIFLVVMLMATAFAGCGRKEEPEDTPDVAVADKVEDTSTPEPEETPASTPEEASEEPTEEPAEEPATDTPESASEPAQTGEVEADLVLGTVEGNTYTNGYFGFTLPIPEGWFVATREQLAQLLNAALDYLENDSGAGTIDLETLQIVPLIIIAEQDPSSSIGPNSNLACTAQNISQYGSLIKDLKTYMNMAVQGLKAQGVEQSGDIEYLNIGGQEVARVSAKQSVAGIALNQTMYVFMKNGFVVMFTLTSNTDEGMQTLENIMSGIAFK